MAREHPTARRALGRLLVACAALAVALAATGCDGGDEQAQPTEPPETTAPTTSTEPGGETTPEPTQTRRVLVYFVRGEQVGAVGRSVPSTPRVLRAALEELLDGPTPREAEWGLTTAVPDGVAVRGVEVADGTATIDLSEAFDDGGGSLSMVIRLAQLVHTATQFPSVDRVALRLEGEPVDVFSAEGVELPATLSRADVEEQAPAILVESPVPGETVSGPLHVRGTANTFEATLELQLVDEGGRELAATFATATCGTGCRGTFTADLPFEGTGPATLRAFERSAKDGSETKLVEIPVVLG